MKVFLLLGVLFWSTALLSYGQSRCIATVVDGSNNPVLGAVAMLYDTSDSLTTHSVVSDGEGRFMLDAEFSFNVMMVRALGFQSQRMAYNAHPLYIVLQEQVVSIDAVTVQADVAVVKHDKGVATVKLKGTYLERYATLSEVLALLPALNIKDDQISVVGYGTALILLNGKEIPSIQQIVTLDPKTVKEIKIRTVTSAQYDATYKSIVEITTTQSLDRALALSVYNTAIVGRKFSDDVGLNFNHRSEQFEQVLSYRYRHIELLDYTRVEEQNIFGVNEVLRNIYVDTMAHNRNAHNLFLASRYNINNRHSIAVQYGFFDVMNRPIFYDASLFSQRNNQPIQYTAIHKQSTYHAQDHTATLQYNGRFDSLSTLAFEGIYINKEAQSDEHTIEQGAGGRRVVKQNNQSLSDAVLLNVDFTTILPRRYILKAGTRYAQIHYHNYGLRTIDALNMPQDKTRNTEHTVALYAVVEKNFGVLEALLGVRGEWNTSVYRHNQMPALPHTNFFLFPSVSLNYEINPRHAIRLDYSSGIARPSFNNLSPIVTYLNPYAYITGNPNLQPTIHHDIRLTFTIAKHLELGGRYSANQNYLIYTTINDENDPKIIKYQPINLDKTHFWYITASYSNKFRWYQLSSYGLLTIPHIQIPIGQQLYAANNPSIYLSANSTFTLSKQVNCNIQFTYRSRAEYGNEIIDPLYDLAVGVSVDFGRGWSASFRAADLLWRNTPSQINRYANIETLQVNNNDIQRFRLSLKYMINNVINTFRRSSDSEQDMRRM